MVKTDTDGRLTGLGCRCLVSITPRLSGTFEPPGVCCVDQQVALTQKSIQYERCRTSFVISSCIVA